MEENELIFPSYNCFTGYFKRNASQFLDLGFSYANLKFNAKVGKTEISIFSSGQVGKVVWRYVLRALDMGASGTH